MSIADHTLQVEEEIQLAPLDQVIERHFPYLPGMDATTFKQVRLAFCQSLEALAADYAEQRRYADAAEARRQRYQTIAAVAQQLRFAVDGLSEDDVQALSGKQGEAFREHVAELDEVDAYDRADCYRYSEEPYGPRSAKRMQEWKDLYWLAEGAKRLSQPRKRGRPENVAERKAACQFVILCSRHGWSPVHVANSGTEKQSSKQPAPSPAVICLAAVFRAADVDRGWELIRARSALKSFREDNSHVEWPADDDQAYDSEPIHYTVSLTRVKAEWPSLFGDLPNFIPTDK